eukprot:CAMPEP_0178441068 /NCGR_PEP_ID=MMETSP0689_2-20121128/37253_1 /TAXON_ID=160604 /ORGANISM="Amphidinium massartii, Strain CS-259" /LENGTH=158 /DNA_ID=CAMNT_0020064161 /DNA_START=1 /DNA_END=473 /DNA_ORIENTATION=+
MAMSAAASVAAASLETSLPALTTTLGQVAMAHASQPMDSQDSMAGGPGLFEAMPPAGKFLMVVLVLYLLSTSSWRCLIFLLALQASAHFNAGWNGGMPSNHVQPAPLRKPQPSGGLRSGSSGGSADPPAIGPAKAVPKPSSAATAAAAVGNAALDSTV